LTESSSTLSKKRIQQQQRTGQTIKFFKVAAEIPEKSKPDASNHEGKYPTRDTSVTFTNAGVTWSKFDHQADTSRFIPCTIIHRLKVVITKFFPPPFQIQTPWRCMQTTLWK
jgi:hypothetical protein